MRLLDDVTRGAWLGERVGDWARVGGVAGTGFAAYARILHPIEAWREDLDAPDEWGMHPTVEEARWRWSDIAARTGRTMHPLVQSRRLTDDEQRMSFEAGWRIAQIREGFFPPADLAALVPALSAATTAPDDITAGIWDGWGELHGPPAFYMAFRDGPSDRGEVTEREIERSRAEFRAALDPAVERASATGPFLELPGRTYLLFETTLRELSDPEWVQGAGLAWTESSEGVMPQLIWPADHAWVVASEIDWDSTIVAGPRGLIDAVLGDERFEAFEVHEDSDLTWDGDTINRPRG